MEDTLTIAGRSLRQRRARTVFSALGIGVGIATVVAVFTLDHNTMLARGSSGGPWQAEIAVSPSQLADGVQRNVPFVQPVRGRPRTILPSIAS